MACARGRHVAVSHQGPVAIFAPCSDTPAAKGFLKRALESSVAQPRPGIHVARRWLPASGCQARRPSAPGQCACDGVVEATPAS